MSKLNIAVIFGGCSNEHDVSIGSGATVIQGLNRQKYNVTPVYISREGKWFLFEGEDFKNIESNTLTPLIFSPSRGGSNFLVQNGDTFSALEIDIAFPALLGRFGEDGTIQGLFEMAGLPYVGCGVLSSALCMEKVFSHDISSTLNIPQPPYITHVLGDNINLKAIIEKLGLPCFVKPVRSGSSVGITKAKTEEELKTAITEAFKHDSRLIFQKNIEGRELKCAVLGTGGDDTVASFPGETIYSSADFYDYEAKYLSAETRKQIPADVSEEIGAKVQGLALKVFKALHCAGLSRVDFFLEDGTGDILFNEINTFPAFTGVSMYPNLCKHMGYPMDVLLDKLIEIAQRTVR
ncbi:MAG: D-alanine--D-alanine ligase [Defluviitaleaceae bacterium]|nr:D-alanine--D-alanine ligase [Defluviitaleaceae bacterium]